MIITYAFLSNETNTLQSFKTRINRYFRRVCQVGSPDFIRLISELIYLCKKPDFHLKSINCLNELIVKDDLKDVWAQIFHLIQSICTLPSTSASVERSFSTMKRIKTYSRSSQSENRLSALTII